MSRTIFSVASLRALGSRKHAGAVALQWERQGGKCAYSGLPIELSTTAQLDHVRPKSVHGDAAPCPTEIRWVHKDVNRGKGNLELTEYLNLCKIVLEHFGYEVVRRKI